MARNRALFATLVALSSALALGCGASSEPAPQTAADAKKPASDDPLAQAAPPSPAKAPEKIQRSALRTVLPTGLPWLLRRVWPEEVFREGKFAGWRLVAIPEEWTGLDLRPDDVVTRVNGKAIETPDQLWESWTSLATAPELRVSYERSGDTKEIVLPIEGAPEPELLASLTNPSPPPRKPTTKKTTIVIEGRDPLGTLNDGE